MNDNQRAVAESCLKSAYDGRMDFPSIVGALVAAGFDGYAVDYRCKTAAYYLPSGESLVLDLPADDVTVAIGFDAPAVKRAIGEAQRGEPGYTYEGFCQKVKAAGCAGYFVSFPGRRVLYIGRTAETHVEHFPD